MNDLRILVPASGIAADTSPSSHRSPERQVPVAPSSAPANTGAHFRSNSTDGPGRGLGCRLPRLVPAVSTPFALQHPLAQPAG